MLAPKVSSFFCLSLIFTTEPSVPSQHKQHREDTGKRASIIPDSSARNIAPAAAAEMTTSAQSLTKAGIDKT